MSDLYKDFVYTKTTASVTSGSTTVTVDDTSLLPTNTALSSADFWMVFDSTLTYPNTFEIVKLTNVNTGTSTITITRGQGGTTAQSHTSGTLLKGALTADMMTRVSRKYRALATATTSSLALGASDSTTTIAMSCGYRLYSISTSRPARVRLYTTTAARTADLGRVIGTDPASTAGVVLDFVTTAASTTYSLSPLVDGADLEGTPSANIPMTVTNNDTSTGTVTVTLNWLQTE